ncbi:MAG TPA: c-type cytochrome [Conexibacter sp.]|nr:c-type cytochrome [Conexibacter sp.]
MLSPHSRASREIAALWWWMLAIAVVVFGGAVALLALGWWRRRSAGLPIVGRREGAATGTVIAFGIAIPLVVNLGVFVVANFVVARATNAPNPRTTPMTLDVVGHQWFWAVRYPGTPAVTANEIHIPAGVRVNTIATTDDVIHSLWVPQLNRKIDMIPGYRNRVLLESGTPGRYRGQCAEFCGLQHAHMGLYVFADPPARFRAWLANEAGDARAPVTAQERRGQQVFMQQGCAGCHTIRGTGAQGTIGPDLTHVASRTTLGALAIPNTPAELAAWIRDPQQIKPGDRMPALGLSGPDLAAVTAYLERLR